MSFSRHLLWKIVYLINVISDRATSSNTCCCRLFSCCRCLFSSSVFVMTLLIYCTHDFRYGEKDYCVWYDHLRPVHPELHRDISNVLFHNEKFTYKSQWYLINCFRYTSSSMQYYWEWNAIWIRDSSVYAYLPACLCICLFAYLFVCLSAVCVFAYLSVNLFVFLSLVAFENSNAARCEAAVFAGYISCLSHKIRNLRSSLGFARLVTVGGHFCIIRHTSIFVFFHFSRETKLA